MNRLNSETKGNYLKYIGCGLARDAVVSFYNFCVMEKKHKILPHMGIISNMAAPIL